ncbi:ISK5 inhibitor, partial [Aegotheles bennettii]|nr:ISK5 inhibitor [Aegotheles bennettii]
QDDCSEYRSQFEAGGRLSCTRENDPVRDSSGKQHTNKCLMCAEKFKKEVQRGGQSGGTAQRNKQVTSGRTNQVRWSSEPVLSSEEGAGENLRDADGQG